MADEITDPIDERAREKEFIDAAMKIMMPAGDARNLATASLDALLDAGDEAMADDLLRQADESIRQAHLVQTELIQSEARREMVAGTSTKIPMFFIHAQDTLMTIWSEVNLIKSMERMYKAIMNAQKTK